MKPVEDLSKEYSNEIHGKILSSVFKKYERFSKGALGENYWKNIYKDSLGKCAKLP